MTKKEARELVKGDKVKGAGVIKQVKDFGNRIVVVNEDDLPSQFDAGDEVEVDD